MRYYQYHIGDFNNATRYASRLERSIYRDLLDMYYEQESAIDGTDINKLERRLNVRSTDEQAALAFVLTEYFESQDSFYFNDRCEIEIKKYQDKLEGAIKAGRASAEARRKKATKKQRKGVDGKGLDGNSTDVEQTLNDGAANVQPTINQEPLTINQEPLTNDKTIGEVSKDDADSLVEFWNENRPPNAQVKTSVWVKKVETRLKTFTADEIKQAMNFVINNHWYQTNSQVLIKNIIDSDERCAKVLEKSNQPQPTANNQQGSNNANHQSANSSNQQFDTSTTAGYAAKMDADAAAYFARQ